MNCVFILGIICLLIGKTIAIGKVLEIFET